MTENVYLLLGNGQVFAGKSFGARGCVTGEVVFTTSMTGYLETLTDPSYFGQIVMMTFPLIGNYGVIPSDFENDRSHVKAFIVREWCEEPSNFRNQGKLDDLLKKQNIIGLYGIDTRRLTRIIREYGVMNARIINESSPEAVFLTDDKKKQALLESIKAYKVEKAVESVSPEKQFINEASKPPAIKDSDGNRIWIPVKPRAVIAAKKLRVVLWDFGAKASIRHELCYRGCEVISMPASSTAEQILSQNPDGIMLSNGPGNPAENIGVIAELAKILKNHIPLFGICLGHQLLALASGAKTEKLKYGHRGGNQPVLNLQTGRVYISSQNHGYAVISETIPPNAELSFVNTNDNTCEGIRYPAQNAFSVQFHPEASSGPLDTGFLFDDFINLMQTSAKARS